MDIIKAEREYKILEIKKVLCDVCEDAIKNLHYEKMDLPAVVDKWAEPILRAVEQVEVDFEDKWFSRNEACCDEKAPF